MAKLRRRDFLASGSALAAATALVPAWLSCSARELAGGGRRRRLVVIQLAGGNDGLATLVPTQGLGLEAARPTLTPRAGSGAAVVEGLRWGAGTEQLARLADAGLLAGIQAVGYPNAHRSHFISTDVWHAGHLRPEPGYTGWLGRYLDAECADRPLAVSVAPQARGLMRGESCRDYQFAALAKTAGYLDLLGNEDVGHGGLPEDPYVAKLRAASSAQTGYLLERTRRVARPPGFPATPFGQQLADIARLLLADEHATVYYAEQGGYDTHAGQAPRHEALMRDYGEAVGALVSVLREARLLDETLIFTFSEFGRRVAVNGSGGTDHGKANLAWVIGGAVRPPAPRSLRPELAELDDGDLAMRVDFRAVYATILRRWLGADPRAIVGDFAPLDFI